MKVGSERQAATSPNSANGCVVEIGYFSRAALSAGTLQNWPSIGRFTPKKLLGGTWAKRALSASLLGGTLASRNYAYNLMPSCSRQLRTDPWFSSGQFSSLGTQNRPETVPRLPDTPGCPGASRYHRQWSLKTIVNGGYPGASSSDPARRSNRYFLKGF